MLDFATIDKANAMGIDLESILGFKPEKKAQVVKIPDNAVLITQQTMEGYGFKSTRGLGKRFAAMGKRQGVTFKVRTGDGPDGIGIYVWKVEN